MANAREQLHLFFTNPVLLSCIFSWFSSQLLKTLIKLFSRKVHSVGELFDLLLWRTGSMPSSHSALVATLCTTIGFRSGVGSDVFILSLGFLLVTVRDAVGVRRANGIQARLLNSLGRTLAEKGIMDFKPIKEVQGHTPAEVAIGCLLGFFIGLAFSVLA
ncbi:MAG TPA: phosphatidic acid phosphatase [Treponema sp.]|nr:phosphatidic acid phosphatase [Treponema sp.]